MARSLRPARVVISSFLQRHDLRRYAIGSSTGVYSVIDQQAPRYNTFGLLSASNHVNARQDLVVPTSTQVTACSANRLSTSEKVCIPMTKEAVGSYRVCSWPIHLFCSVTNLKSSRAPSLRTQDGRPLCMTILSQLIASFAKLSSAPMVINLTS
jgi:hypothetical protein